MPGGMLHLNGCRRKSMNFDEVFERWAIQTTDGHMSDERSIAWIARTQGTRAADYIMRRKTEIDAKLAEKEKLAYNK